MWFYVFQYKQGIIQLHTSSLGLPCKHTGNISFTGDLLHASELHPFSCVNSDWCYIKWLKAPALWLPWPLMLSVLLKPTVYFWCLLLTVILQQVFSCIWDFRSLGTRWDLEVPSYIHIDKGQKAWNLGTDYLHFCLIGLILDSFILSISLILTCFFLILRRTRQMFQFDIWTIRKCYIVTIQ